MCIESIPRADHLWERKRPLKRSFFSRLLERDLAAYLPPSRQRFARYFTKAPGVQVALDICEVHVVEDVEKLKPELQIEPLCNMCVLVHRGICLEEAGIAELTGLLVSVRTGCRCRELGFQDATGEIGTPRRQLAITGNVGIIQVVSIGVVIPAVRERGTVENREGISRLVNTRPTESPPSRQLPHCSLTVT